MSRENLLTEECAPPPAFMSQAVKVGNTIYVSGQLARRADGGMVGVGDMGAQARQAILNVERVLRAGGAELRHVVKMNTYFMDMKRAPEAWAVREEFFGPNPPACTGVEITSLTVPEALIEIEVIAIIED